MKRVLKVLTNWWVLSLSAAAVMAILLVLVLPMLAHGLRPWPWRLALLATVMAVWGAAALVRFLLQRRAAARLASALEAEEPRANSEGALLTGRMREALAKLKADSGGRRNYLYSRPWYVIIGAPGAGKTTALLNSGLRFPFSDTALKGVGGTRNLDFWFADEAVLVDTAGRYTSQDSDEARDKEGWTRFLSLLRTNRPLQPINGVFVAVSLDSIANADCAAIDRQADTIRRRLRELREGLQTIAPVYVIFTKSDLIAGFREYYDDLDVEGRRAVLGATLPLDGPADARSLAVAFDEVAQAVADRVSGRIQAELDARRRGLIIGFPAQLECLRDGVVRLLAGAFPAEAQEPAGELRGFYFTSGVQEGAPLDALLGGMAALAEIEPDARGRGRAYFINRLLGEVVFREAGLARKTPEARRKDAMATTAVYAGIGALSALLVLAWTASFIANLGYQKKVIAAAEALQPSLHGVDMREVSAADPGLAEVLPVLDSLRSLPGGYDDRRAKGFPKFPLGLGLHDDGLSRDVEEVYLDGVQRIMLPRLMLRMEDFLRENRQSPVELYSGLRAYRLISGDAPPKIHKRDVGSVAEWVTADWSRYSLAGGDMTRARETLGRHLDALLAEPEIGRVWGGGSRAPFDPALVTSTQAILMAQLTPGQRGYAILRDLPTEGRPWRPALPPEKLKAFAAPARVQALSVPHLFTREGYFKQYQANLPKVIEQLASEGWVLGEQSSIPASARVGLAGEIGQAYAAEYSRRWREVLAALAPADYVRNDEAAQALFAPPSPLAVILDQVKRETNLSLPGKKMPAIAGLDAGSRITADFSSLSGFDAAAFVTLVKQVKEASLRARTDPTAAMAVQDASSKLQMMAMSLPSDDLRPFVSGAAGQAGAAGVSFSADSLKQEYQQTILPTCQRVTGQAYPFVRSATTDASRREVADFFGPGGVLDMFVKGKLASHIDLAGPFWRWKLDDPVAQQFVSSPQRFQEARDLQMLMSDGLQMQMTAISFSPGVNSVEVRIGSATHVFTRGDTRPVDFRWTPGDNATASVTFQGTPDYLYQSGEWAVFRLFGPPTQLVNTGDALKATFAKGTSSATFRVVLPRTMKNPFRDGPWGFRCPAEL
jgi:type VI secretion system protein ImpL